MSKIYLQKIVHSCGHEVEYGTFRRTMYKRQEREKRESLCLACQLRSTVAIINKRREDEKIG